LKNANLLPKWGFFDSQMVATVCDVADSSVKFARNATISGALVLFDLSHHKYEFSCDIKKEIVHNC